MCIYWLYTKNNHMQSFYSFKAAMISGCHYQAEGFKITQQLNEIETEIFISGNWKE